ncbi:MAG: hypothetical protein LBD32_00635 [Cytophagales bacterium]|jgi:D-alanine-D-alanine ligase|nr:hypothetical protein [Cytophagales bacterium]
MRVGVFLGGISAEKDVSLESGRNVFEKINSKGEHRTTPIFVSGRLDDIKLYILPFSLLFKDNADLISEAIKNYERSRVEKDEDLQKMLKNYVENDVCKVVTEITFDLLPKIIDFAFLALHGGPGEGGTFQRILDKLKIPYNGSSAEVSELAINKFRTNRFLAQHGVFVANQYVIDYEDWIENKYKILLEVEKKFSFPFVVKPVDDGSSVGVFIIENSKIFEHYVETVFLIENHEEEFKNLKIVYHKKILIEDLIEKGDAKKILEVTGGFLTHKKNESIEYEMFFPSESIAVNKILSMEEKFLTGEGQNITPARYAENSEENLRIEGIVKEELKKVAALLNLRGYARIDAFVKIFDDRVEVWILEVNTLPALTPATCIFHQCILNGYSPADFIQEIINFAL